MYILIPIIISTIVYVLLITAERNEHKAEIEDLHRYYDERIKDVEDLKWRMFQHNEKLEDEILGLEKELKKLTDLNLLNE